jgi:hypothetical protein
VSTNYCRDAVMVSTNYCRDAVMVSIQTIVEML